ncbi:ATP adenylyltransferase [Malassezia caprae]|uniref:ATP adenylyltransferase n=1 Tax=Malassezia caprae TaxID=1381934 RepID=A0AAF0IVU5_9BASI|nr:ATP adenylyltransferase [Malassezia caprae]
MRPAIRPRSLPPIVKTVTGRVFMSQLKLKNLASIVSKQYETAIASGDAFFYESQVSVAKTEGVENVVPWHIRNVPALLKKPKAITESQSTEKPQQNKVDVFAPPYVPNLLVQQLDNFTLLAYQIITTYTPSEPDMDMLGFFNCGQDSAVPIEVLLDQIEKDGKEMGV